MSKEITITQQDFIRLHNLINVYRNKKTTDKKNIAALGNELKRAVKIDSHEIEPKYITMNSVVDITDLDSGKEMTIKLVYPYDAQFREGNISILSPLGSALLGYSEGDTISFDVPAGTKNIRVNKIVYQPEANGDYSS